MFSNCMNILLCKVAFKKFSKTVPNTSMNYSQQYSSVKSLTVSRNTAITKHNSCKSILKCVPNYTIFWFWKKLLSNDYNYCTSLRLKKTVSSVFRTVPNNFWEYFNVKYYFKICSQCLFLKFGKKNYSQSRLFSSDLRSLGSKC